MRNLIRSGAALAKTVADLQENCRNACIFLSSISPLESFAEHLLSDGKAEAARPLMRVNSHNLCAAARKLRSPQTEPPRLAEPRAGAFVRDKLPASQSASFWLHPASTTFTSLSCSKAFCFASLKRGCHWPLTICSSNSRDSRNRPSLNRKSAC